MREYRPSMDVDVLHAWAKDVVAVLAQQPADCPHRERCECIGACKHGMAGSGATEAAAAPQPPAEAQPDRMAIKLLVAAGFVTEAKANEALNIAHGFDKGPLEPAEAQPVAHTFYVLHDATEGQKYIKKSVDDGCLAIFEGEEDAQRAKRRHPGTEYKRVDYYAAQQPAPSVPVGVEEHEGAMTSADYIEHCAGVLREHGYRVTASTLADIAAEHRALAQQGGDT